VVLRIAAIGIPFVETQVRAGHSPRAGAEPRLPIIPGNGVGGTVITVGADVDPRLIGRRFVTSTGGSGGYAEQVAVAAAGLIPIPDDLDMLDAVALLADGRTALALAQAARIGAGDRVLVPAAGGGVGTLLIQLARNAGAGTIVGAAGSETKRALARDVGADQAIDYRRPDWVEQARQATGGDGFDVVFDGVGGAIGRAAFELTASGGRYIIFGLSSGSLTEASLAEIMFRGIIVIGGPQIRSAAQLRDLSAAALREAAAGRLHPVVGQTFPLEQAADAHAAIERRTTIGKTLLIA
jgi:NADPH2:quinone reductase